VTCRLCGSSEARPLVLGGLAYADCPGCRYLGLDRRHFPERSAEEARYRLHRNDPKDRGYREYLEAFVDVAIAGRTRAGGAVLDFGSGPRPVLASILLERGYDVGAYDPFFAPSKAWRRKAWECIAVHEVAEHFRAPRLSFSILARGLAPGGIIALRTRFAPEREEDLEAWWYRRDPTHLGFFRPASIERIGRELGLDVELLAPPDIGVLKKHQSFVTP
jgi:SAM-dependent methyltransferase